VKGETQTSAGGEVHGKAVTHRKILEAATELFVARGYERTTIERVAARAGVSRAAIFWHFTDKASLFREVCAQLLTPFRAALEESLSHLDPGKRLAEMFDTYERFVLENRETIRAFLRWMLEHPALRDALRRSLLELHASFAEDIRTALAELLPPEADIAPLAAGLSALLDGSLVQRLLEIDGSGAPPLAGARAILALIPQRRERS
jgi:TetR/AcrR family transcriptional regulator, acrAB operon repressor